MCAHRRRRRAEHEWPKLVCTTLPRELPLYGVSSPAVRCQGPAYHMYGIAMEGCASRDRCPTTGPTYLLCLLCQTTAATVASCVPLPSNVPELA